MTQIKYSGLVSAMSGKLNGSILQKIRSGDSIRNLVQPFDPRSGKQIDHRVMFQTLIKIFSLLPAGNIAAWNAFAKEYNWQNKLGDSYNPTGQMMFTRCNLNIGLCNAGFISMPVTPVSREQMPAFTVPYNPAHPSMMYVMFPGYTVPADTAFLVYATQSLSPGIAYAYKYLKLIDIIPAGTVGSYEFGSTYSALFGSWVYSKKVFFKVRQIELTSGFAAKSLYANTIIF